MTSNTSGSSRFLAGTVALCAVITVSTMARAEDMGEIALVEDVDGSINASVALPNIYLQNAACAFYESHDDIYDAIFVFTSIRLNFLTNVQQGWPVLQDQEGIGRGAWDQTAAFCSLSGRLRHAVKMGELRQLPADPDARYTGIPFYPLSGIELLGHEFGHHWMASIQFETDGITHCFVRGYEPSGEPVPGECDGYESSGFNQHWSYYFNSHSLMYGSMIEDLGGGTFRFFYESPRYAELDQYLMGLRLAEDVPPQFLVDVGDVAGSGSSSLPLQPGTSVEETGTRVDFTIDDVIAAMGPRVPELEPCHWKGAFIIVHAAGQPPTDDQVAKAETYRRRWEEFYDWATDNRGSFDTTLDGSGAGTTTCPAAGEIDGDADADIDADADGDSDADADGVTEGDADVDGDTDSDGDGDGDGDSDGDGDVDGDGDDDGAWDADDDGGGCSCGTASARDDRGPSLGALLTTTL